MLYREAIDPERQEFVKKLKDRHIIPKKTSAKNNLTKTTQGAIKIYINENYSKPPKKKYLTNETDVYHIDDVWSTDILDLKYYGPENKKGYRFDLVVIAISQNMDEQFLSKKMLKQQKTLSKWFF